MLRYMFGCMIGIALLFPGCGEPSSPVPDADQARHSTQTDTMADSEQQPDTEDHSTVAPPDDSKPSPQPITTTPTRTPVPQTVEQTLADIDNMVSEGRFTEARRLAQEQAAAASNSARDILNQRVSELRRLERQAVQATSAIELLSGNTVEQRRGRRMLLDSGPAGRILLTEAVLTGPPALADQAATLLVILDETPAFPALLQRLLTSEQTVPEQNLAEKLRDAMIAMVQTVDSAVLRALSDMIPQQTGVRRRHLIDIMLAIGEDAAVDRRLGTGTADELRAYIKQAFESGDAALVDWSFQHAGRAGLGIPGFRAEWHHNRELEGPHQWRSIETVINWPQVDEIPLVTETGQRTEISGRFTGDLIVTQPGTYTFYTNSDDGSRLWIDDAMIVDNWGLHGMQVRSGDIDLQANTIYQVRIDWMQAGGGAGLIVTYKGPGDEDERLLDSTVIRTLPWEDG